MKLEHAYLKIDGQEFFDYDLYCDDIGNNIDLDPSKDYFVCDEKVLNMLEYPEKASFLDYSTKPPKNSSIYLSPKLPYPIDDIRKNYNIKRVPDSGDYNVIGPLNLSYNRTHHIYGYSIAIFPSINTVYVKKRNGAVTKENLYKEACMCIPNADFADMKLAKFSTWVRFHIVVGMNVYKQLLDRTLTKTCVPYTSLDIAGANPLTFDVLTLAQRAGALGYHENDAEKNFIMQLNVLNQHNWREYPGTISMVFGEMLGNDRNNIYTDVKGHSSRYSKVVKELLKCRGKEFAGKKDYEFARDYINSLLDVGDCRFTTIMDLWAKLRTINLSQQTFDKLFNNVVRLTPKTYDE